MAKKSRKIKERGPGRIVTKREFIDSLVPGMASWFGVVTVDQYGLSVGEKRVVNCWNQGHDKQTCDRELSESMRQIGKIRKFIDFAERNARINHRLALANMNH